jgi:hypothetical protein
MQITGARHWSRVSRIVQQRHTRVERAHTRIRYFLKVSTSHFPHIADQTMPPDLVEQPAHATADTFLHRRPLSSADLAAGGATACLARSAAARVRPPGRCVAPPPTSRSVRRETGTARYTPMQYSSALMVCYAAPYFLLSLSDYASVLLFTWGLYERAHIIRYFPPLASALMVCCAAHLGGPVAPHVGGRRAVVDVDSRKLVQHRLAHARRELTDEAPEDMPAR